MKWHHRCLSSILFAFAKLASYLPLGFLYFKVSILRFFAERVFRYRYQVIVQNLSRSFPEKNYHEIKVLAHQFYRHFFEIFAEVIKGMSFSTDEARTRFKIENPELIQEFHAKGISVIALGGHRGNWEWISFASLFSTFGTYTLYKPLSSPVMDHLVNRIRGRFGIKLLAMNQAGRFILSKKDSPALYFFVGDQSPSHKDPEYSFDFLNQPSLLFTGGAKLARATKSAVVYVAINKVKRGYYSVKYSIIAEPHENKNEQEILSSYAKMLEDDIRLQPAYWLWSHKRWKHKATNS